MSNYDIKLFNNTKRADYDITCFERRIILIFKNFEDFDCKEIYDNLEYNYYKWCEDAECQCCEETLIDKMPKIYKDNLIAVIYENDDEESDENE